VSGDFLDTGAARGCAGRDTHTLPSLLCAGGHIRSAQRYRVFWLPGAQPPSAAAQRCRPAFGFFRGGVEWRAAGAARGGLLLLLVLSPRPRNCWRVIDGQGCAARPQALGLEGRSTVESFGTGRGLCRACAGGLWFVGLCRTGSPGRAHGSCFSGFASGCARHGLTRRAKRWRVRRGCGRRAARVPSVATAERAQGRRTVRGRRGVYSSLPCWRICLRAFTRRAGASQAGSVYDERSAPGAAFFAACARGEECDLLCKGTFLSMALYDGLHGRLWIPLERIEKEFCS
jgi:hypothetical protein